MRLLARQYAVPGLGGRAILLPTATERARGLQPANLRCRGSESNNGRFRRTAAVDDPRVWTARERCKLTPVRGKRLVDQPPLLDLRRLGGDRELVRAVPQHGGDLIRAKRGDCRRESIGWIHVGGGDDGRCPVRYHPRSAVGRAADDNLRRERVDRRSLHKRGVLVLRPELVSYLNQQVLRRLQGRQLPVSDAVLPRYHRARVHLGAMRSVELICRAQSLAVGDASPIDDGILFPQRLLRIRPFLDQAVSLAAPFRVPLAVKESRRQVAAPDDGAWHDGGNLLARASQAEHVACDDPLAHVAL